jgi:uncharacterized protein YukE
MGFSVYPMPLLAAGDDIRHLGDHVALGRAQVERVLDGAGGSTFHHLQGALEDTRRELREAYASDGWPLWFRSAGNAVKACALEYDAIDRSAAARADALVEGADGLPAEEQLPDLGSWGGSGTTSAEVADHMESSADLEQLDFYADFRDWLGAFTSLTGWVAFLGVSAPLDAIRRDLEGEWEVIAETYNALIRIERLWTLLRGELSVSVSALDTAWSGRAASAAFDWFDRFDHEVAQHLTAVRSRADAVRVLGDGLRYAFEGAAPYLDVISTIAEEAAAGMLDPGVAVQRILARAGMIASIFDGVIMLVGGLTYLVAPVLVQGDLSLPDDTLELLRSPDVAGP